MSPHEQKTTVELLVAILSEQSATNQKLLIDALQPEYSSFIKQTTQVIDDEESDVAPTVFFSVEQSEQDTSIAVEGSPLAGESSSQPAMTQIDRYKLRSVLGKGGFGIVYLAYDDELQRLVALKTLHRDLLRSENDANAFLAEAQTVAGLDHSNIVPVYDVGQTPDGDYYVVSKFIEGQNLAQLMKDEQISHARSINFVSDIAGALHFAHKSGLTHRDVKPKNILVRTDGTVFLADFGLARKYELNRQEAEVSGTPKYMSPEQFGGGIVDGRSDIFSLGIVLYELLTGKKPFAGGNWFELSDQIVNLDPRPPRQIDDTIPRRLEAICLRCLSKDVKDRYTTALDLKEDLSELATYRPQPIDLSTVALSFSLTELAEKLALNTHDVWAEQRISEGWQYGDVRDDDRKTHPDLVPYEQLTESEKEYDRQTVTAALKAVLAMGYQIEKEPGTE